VRLRWRQALEIDTVVDAYSEAQAIYKAWRFHRDESLICDDKGYWDHAEAIELPDESSADESAVEEEAEV
jgi:hypothetical protein